MNVNTFARCVSHCSRLAAAMAWMVVLANCGSSKTASSSKSTDGSAPEASVAEASAPDGTAPLGGDAGSVDAAHGPPGGPGCGLTSAAFCDTFDAPAPASSQGRAGELDATKWAAGRLDVQLPTGNGCAWGIGPATLPACRPGLPAQVLPDQDTLICNANTDITNPYLLVATAAQNYGENSYRIRQPFDFTSRTGTIVFDAQAYMVQLEGWISLDVTEDPINAPGYAIGGAGVNNDEGSLLPRNAFELQFSNDCAGYAPAPSFSVEAVHVFNDYVDTVLSPTTPTCLATAQGQLSHFEVSVSETHIEVSATPISSDGVTFEPLVLLYSTDVSLPFSRGYVHITTHNHATIKYSTGNSLDAWVAEWDNVGFDGFIISNWREYEVADALTPGTDAWDRTGPNVSIGYRIADASMGPAQTLHLSGVDLTGVTSAQLSLSSYYNVQTTPLPSTYVLQYRFNGGAWRNRLLTTGEIGILTGGNSQGTIGQMLDVTLSDLVQGDNTLEFVTMNVDQSYPPAVGNIDLVLQTN
jgi:hypothetical protein